MVFSMAVDISESQSAIFRVSPECTFALKLSKVVGNQFFQFLNP